MTVYKQGDTSPSLTLSDPDCPEAVAVAEDGYVFVGDYYGAGVEVYPPGATSPSERLTNPNIKELFAVGVDSQRNVYASGWGPQYSYSPVIIEYGPSGGATNLGLEDMTYPSGVLVDKKGDIVESDFWRAVINIYGPGQKYPTSTISTSTEPDRSALDRKENVIYVPTGQGDKVWAVRYPSGSSSKSIAISGFAAGAAVVPAPKP
ncbi:MAG TPA: hypothetical protein VKR56_15540 [Candidatus Cybelea sp.]|nr:hypothetical protein [Candidatus Cybelea sp.]